MKKQTFKSILSFLLLTAMLMSLPLYVGADETEENPSLDMAYNIYSNPVLPRENAFDTFVIEMRSDLDPDCTYWSLANLQLHISEQTKALYRDITGGHVYAGLQHSGGARRAIMAFWEWHYWPNGVSSGEEETNLTAQRVYPDGSNDFGGEGEGTNCIKYYHWETSKWYRMVLHTWDDPVTGTTMCGQWFQNVETGEYTLISYFDTKMINSYMKGDMSFFMENFYGINAGEERDVKIKNMYVRTYADKNWVSVNSSELSHCNNWAGNKTGNHSFGATEEYFWGKAGGFVPADKQAILDKSQKPTKYTIKQPEKPTIGNIIFDELQLRSRDEQQFVRWYFEEASTPQLSYRVKCTDVDGKVIYDKTEWAPEDFYHILEGVTTNAYLCELTVTDVFGGEKTIVNATDAYLEVHPDAPITNPVEGEGNTDDETPDNNGDGTVNDNNTPAEKEDDKTVALIVAISLGGVLLVAAAAATFVVMAKKKKKNR